MKYLILSIFISYQAYNQDYLFQEMGRSWSSNQEQIKETDYAPNEICEDCEAEHYSWDDIYLDPYEETEIIY